MKVFSNRRKCCIDGHPLARLLVGFERCMSKQLVTPIVLCFSLVKKHSRPEFLPDIATFLKGIDSE